MLEGITVIMLVRPVHSQHNSVATCYWSEATSHTPDGLWHFL